MSWSQLSGKFDEQPILKSISAHVFACVWAFSHGVTWGFWLLLFRSDDIVIYCQLVSADQMREVYRPDGIPVEVLQSGGAANWVESHVLCDPLSVVYQIVSGSITCWLGAREESETRLFFYWMRLDSFSSLVILQARWLSNSKNVSPLKCEYTLDIWYIVYYLGTYSSSSPEV